MKTCLLILAALLAVAPLNAQTGLDQRPTSAGNGTFENMFDRRAREAKERQQQAEADARKAESAKLEAVRTQLNQMGAKTIRGKVLSVVKPGEQVLVQCGSGGGDPKCYLTGAMEALPRLAAPDGLGDFVVVLLKTPPALGSLVDGDQVNVVAGPTAETYQYRTALGAAATVRVYGMVLKK